MTSPHPEHLREQLQFTLRDRYTLERELSGGGMSRVFLAEELRLRRRVVIKVLSPELAQGISLERFEREIQTVAALQQANIVPVHTAGDTNGLPYFTMPFVDGESLRVRLSRGRIPVAEVVGILRDITRALTYAHARGVVHRDIKPDNVLMSGGAAVVTDFGIAKAISVSRTLAGAPTLTQVGLSIGTPAYMAPEQAAGDPTVDHRADLYSLGATAYELLTGQVVFPGRTGQRMMAAHMAEHPRPVSELRSDIPQALATLVMRCLEKEVHDRPQHASEIGRALDAIAGSGTVAAISAESTPLWKALLVYVAAFVAVGILAKAAIVGIGLPSWVFPGAMALMALGLPALLWTGYVQHVARRVRNAAPARTPGGGVVSAKHDTMTTFALRAAPQTSWKRTRRGGVMVMMLFVAIVTTFMVMRAFGIGPAATLFSRGKLVEQDKLILTDFTASNGDTLLASTVSFAVRTVLDESRVLSIVPQSATSNALERMARPSGDRLDLVTAREIARRDGAKAVVHGEVVAVGTEYLLTLKLFSADSGRVLASVQETGDGADGLLVAAGDAALALREEVGESLRSIRSAVPLARARTASLEALQLFHQGVYQAAVKVDEPKARELLRQALLIDSIFPEAWRRLGVILPRGAQADSALANAYKYRSALPRRDRLNIEATYFQFGPGRNRGKAIDLLEAREGNGGNLAILLRSRREYARAESIYRDTLARDTTFALAHRFLIGSLINRGNLDSAAIEGSIYKRRFGAQGYADQNEIRLEHLRGRWDAYERRVDSASRVSSSPGERAWWRDRSEELALLRGQLTRWRQSAHDRISRESAGGITPPVMASLAFVIRAVTQLDGDAASDVRQYEAALVTSPLRNFVGSERADLQLATDLALAGRVKQAQSVLAGYNSTMLDTALLREQQPARHTALGAIALAERR